LRSGSYNRTCGDKSEAVRNQDRKWKKKGKLKKGEEKAERVEEE
jgi:hypothetical protein